MIRPVAAATSHTFDPHAVPTPIRRQFDHLDDAIDFFIGEWGSGSVKLDSTVPASPARVF
jgi:hypothetical protein